MSTATTSRHDHRRHSDRSSSTRRSARSRSSRRTAVCGPCSGPARTPGASSSTGRCATGATRLADRRSCELAADQLAEYFDGERTTFDVPLDPIGTDFQQPAWAALRTIPYGETISYGEQAARVWAIVARPGPSARRTVATRSRSSCRVTGWSDRPAHSPASPAVSTRRPGSSTTNDSRCSALTAPPQPACHKRGAVDGAYRPLASGAVAGGGRLGATGAFGFLLGGLRLGPLGLDFGLLRVGALAGVDRPEP